MLAEVGKRMVVDGGNMSKEALRENGILGEEERREPFERSPAGYGYRIAAELARKTRMGWGLTR